MCTTSGIKRKRMSVKFGLTVLGVALTVAFVWPTHHAVGEERKFVVMLAVPPKSVRAMGNQYPPENLPNYDDIRDYYFDNWKPEINSFSEYWQEISYGEVSVTGDVFGWVEVPWAALPDEDVVDEEYEVIITHTSLNGGGFNQFTGEGFNQSRQMYKIDWNGSYNDDSSTGTEEFPFSTADDYPAGLVDFDTNGAAVWTPGERFLDLNGNGRYDALLEGTNDGYAGKNGDVCTGPDGVIDSGEYCDEAVVGTNGMPGDGDGEWDFPEPFEDFLVIYNPSCTGDNCWIKLDASTNNLYEGDEESVGSRVWAEAYIRNNYPGDADALIARCGNGRYDGPDSWTEVGTTKYQRRPSYNGGLNISNAATPEPDDSWYKVQYADTSGLPNWWEDYWFDEHIDDLVLPKGDTPLAPEWPLRIPAFVQFDPLNPNAGDENYSRYRDFNPNGGGTNARSGSICDPDLSDVNSNGECTEISEDAPTANTGNGFMAGGLPDGTIYPDETGYYDGPAEFRDLPSSIYHTRATYEPELAAIMPPGLEYLYEPTWSGFSRADGDWYGGDGRLGEVTSPWNSSMYGQDIGTGNPNNPPVTDGIIPPAGPFAYNIHGASGYDAGNVLTLEYLTWRNYPPTDKYMQRDFNLDGLLDQGEVRVLGSENYARDFYISSPNDGGPGSEYPFNRRRLTEDIVEALDSSVDWDELVMPCQHPIMADTNGDGSLEEHTFEANYAFATFLLPPGLYPEGLAAGGRGLFQLPAPGMDLPIQVQEEDASALSPIWFSDFGTALDDAGEGTGETVTGYAESLMAHEFLHVWEGYPDLYDYDVYQGGIENYPVGAWDIMASGYVHPAPILKERGTGAFPCLEHDPWVQITDLTNVLEPWEEKNITLNDYAFDPINSVCYYENPNAPWERFYFWRQTHNLVDDWDQTPNVVNFSRNSPADGLLIMHTDLETNPEGIPLQQRIGSHFTYYIVQADGLQQMDNSENLGDGGDVFPGDHQVTQWLEHGTDPNSKWWGQKRSGLSITNIVQDDESTDVTFHWDPRVVPELEFIDPPGGQVVPPNYRLKYEAYDEGGGTTLEFYYDTDAEGYDGTYIGSKTKLPGYIGPETFPVPINELAGDRPYWFYARLVPGPGQDDFVDPEYSTPHARHTNRGHGHIVDNVNSNGIAVDLSKSKVEYWTLVCTDASTEGAEQWEVKAKLARLSGRSEKIRTDLTATTDVAYSSGDGEVQFKIVWDGSIGTNASVSNAGGEYFLTDSTASFASSDFEENDLIRIVDGPKPGFYSVVSVPTPTSLRLKTNAGNGFVGEYRVHPFVDSSFDGVPDQYSFFTTGKTEYSVPVSIHNGEVVSILYPAINATYLDQATNPDHSTPTTVQFDASQSRDELWEYNTELEYSWDFGDGTVYGPEDCLDDTSSSSCPIVTHTYTSDFPAGATVTVIARNPETNVSGTKGISVAIGLPDRDEDGVGDDLDNCPDDPNTNQTDSDGDLVGNECDDCPNDPNKILPDRCGCGFVEFDTAPDCDKDCNNNGVQDSLDISSLVSTDCNYNGVPDECDNPIDCDSNGINDICDIFAGGKKDCNNNWIPDICEPSTDCNGNGEMDICDIYPGGGSEDCNFNQIPDECDIAGSTSVDINGNGTPDDCEVDCNTNGVPDDADIDPSDPDGDGTVYADCNNNGVLDVCDIAEGTSTDCQPNGIPDTCDLETVGDCDGDLVPDDCSTFYDCNLNSIRDICDIVAGTSTDCDDDQRPDECETDTDNDGTIDDCDGCPEDPRKVSPGIAGCGFNETDSDNDGTPNVTDQCPQDPNKYLPGVCGCGVKDVDTEVPADGVYDCVDVCAAGNDKLDDDKDGVPNACDECPSDPQKDEPGDCGCGVSDADTDGDGDADCNDNCRLIENPNQADSDQDGTGDACDACPNDPDKVSPGECGCGAADVDTDRDNFLDCNDNCPDIRNANQADGDEDGVGDACDGCPENPAKSDPGVCGCDALETDSDGDSVPDCIDQCPATELGANVDTNGCVSGAPEPGQPVPDDADGDGVADEDDLCPNTPDGVAVNSNGCAVEDDEPTPNACGADAAPCGATGMFGMWLTLCGLGWLKGSRVGRRR